MKSLHARGVVLLTVGVGAVCALSMPLSARMVALRPIPVAGTVVILVLFVIAESMTIHLPLRHDTHTVSFNEVPLTLGLFLVAPLFVLCGSIVGSAVALGVYRRQRGIKLAFNSVQIGAQCLFAIAVFRLAHRIDPAVSPRAYAYALVAVVGADLFSAGLVTCAISLYRGSWAGCMDPWAMLFGSVAAIAKSALALVAVSVITHGDASVLAPLAISAACLYGAFQANATLFERHRRLELLNRFASAVATSVRLDDVARAVVSEARDIMHVRCASLVVRREGGDTVRWELDENGEVDVGLLAFTGTAELDRPRGDALDASSARLTITSSAQSGLEVTLSVLDPLGVERAFDAVDRRLFAALAAQATIALENGDLVEKLSEEALEREYRSTHDVLTGLANRERFVEMLDTAIGESDECGLLVVALNDFGEIKETLGHDNADQLLREVAGRLRSACGAEVQIARLVGEEFAVIWPSATAEHVARVIVNTLTEEIAIDGLPLSVGGTIGCSIAPKHGSDGSALLRCAESALHRAKRQGLTFMTYEFGAEAGARRRLTVAHELRRALERHEIVPYFQPKVDLATGRAVGVEALARWHHPDRGVVLPDDFIPIAEHTGLIDPFTRFMLETVLAHRRSWAEQGLDLNVSVNISARLLLDAKFTERVLRALVRHRCPPDALTLEITESQLMADPKRAARMLTELHDVGVRVSIDDFGTGFSSLTSLRSLPIDEVKIDKSFVLDLARNESDAVIVRSTAGLAENLVLEAVAEGIEDDAARTFLLDVGVRVGQGFLFSPPLPAAGLLSWIQAQVNDSRVEAERVP